MYGLARFPRCRWMMSAVIDRGNGGQTQDRRFGHPSADVRTLTKRRSLRGGRQAFIFAFVMVCVGIAVKRHDALLTGCVTSELGFLFRHSTTVARFELRHPKFPR